MKYILYIPKEMSMFLLHIFNVIYSVLDHLLGLAWIKWQTYEQKRIMKQYIRHLEKERDKVFMAAKEVMHIPDTYHYLNRTITEINIQILILKSIYEKDTHDNDSVMSDT